MREDISVIQYLDQLQGPPHPVLAMGSKVMEGLQQAGALPKNRKIKGLRKRLFALPGVEQATAMLSYGVGVSEIDTQLYTDLLCDFNVMARYARLGTLQAVLGDYQWVSDFGDELEFIKAEAAATGKPVRTSLDTETTGKDAWKTGAYIITLQLSIRPGRSRLVYFKSLEEMRVWLMKHRPQLEFLFNDPRVRICFANGKYDLNWLSVMAPGIECPNFVFDTTAVGSLLDENRTNSLNVHTKLMAPDLGGYDDPLEQRYDKGEMEKVPQDDLLPYAGGDPDACLRVALVEREELARDPQLTKFYNHILHPATRAFEKIEQGGVFVDKEAFKDLEIALSKEMAEAAAEVKKIVGGIMQSRHLDDSKIGGVNITKPAFISEFMFTPWGLNLKPKLMTEKSGKASTAGEHLVMFKDDPNAKDFITAFSKYRGAEKMMSTYCRGFLKHLRDDGKFHPSYYLFVGDAEDDEGGGRTGRLSCREPAFQTIPAHTPWALMIRRCYVAPPGFRMVGKDYSQGELKIMACLSGDPAMLEVYRRGLDLHAVTGGLVNGMTYEQVLDLKKTDKSRYKMIRQRGKAGNFGLIFEISAEGFIDYARINYGVIITLKESQDFIDIFFGQFPWVKDYQEEYKRFAHKHGHVRSPLGRVRHLPLINSPNGYERGHAERQGINSPVQSTLTDMMIWALAIAHQRGWDKQAPCFAVVHDQGLNYVPEDNWEFYVKRDKELMENLPFEKLGWAPQLKFTTDVKIGPNMGDMVEMKLNDNGIFVPAE